MFSSLYSFLYTLFKYIEPLWLGNKKEISIRRVIALFLTRDFIINTNYAIHKWEVGKSYADVAMLLGIEAALIAALLSLTTYSSHFLSRNPDYSQLQQPLNDGCTNLE